MVLQVPSVGLEANNPAMMQGGRITPQQDVVSQDIKEVSAAQSQVAKNFEALREKLQGERDDAVFTEKHNEFQSIVNDKKLEFKMLRGQDAIKQVGVDPETDEPITVADKFNADMSALLEETAGTLENERQKYMFRTAAASTLNSAKTTITTHSIQQQQDYADKEFLNAIDLAAQQTASEWETAFDPGGEFAKMGLVTVKLVERYADNNGMGGYQKQNLINKATNNIHTMTLNNMVLAKKWDQADQYLKNAEKTGTASPELIVKFKETIYNGHTKENAKKKGDEALNKKGNPNDGNFESIANSLQGLDSFNVADDGTGRSIVNGWSGDERDTSNMTKDSSNAELEEFRKDSKFYNEETNTFNLLPQHQGLHLFVGKHLGIDKADAYFTKAKSELKRLGIDPEADGYNDKLVDLVIDYSNEGVINKFGEVDAIPLSKTGTKFTEKIAKDLQIIKGNIDYNYDPSVKPRTNKYGMRLLADIEAELKETISDEDELEQALIHVRKEHKIMENNAKEVYDAEFARAQEIAFANPGGWSDLADEGIDISQFSQEDQAELKNGHPSKSDTNTILFLNANPNVVADIDELNKYRGKLTQSDYLEYVEDNAKFKNGGSGSVIEATVNEDLFNRGLKDYGFERFFEETGDGSDYQDVRLAVKKEIDKRQQLKGEKLSLTEKEDAIAFVLNDKVLMQGSGKKEFPLGAVDDDEYDTAYVRVNKKKVFLRAINDYQREQIIKSYVDSGLSRPTEQQIAEDWVRAGRPTAMGPNDSDGHSKDVDNRGYEIDGGDEFAKSYIKNRTGGIITFN